MNAFTTSSGDGKDAFSENNTPRYPQDTLRLRLGENRHANLHGGMSGDQVDRSQLSENVSQQSVQNDTLTTRNKPGFGMLLWPESEIEVTPGHLPPGPLYGDPQLTLPNLHSSGSHPNTGSTESRLLHSGERSDHYAHGRQDIPEDVAFAQHLSPTEGPLFSRHIPPTDGPLFYPFEHNFDSQPHGAGMAAASLHGHSNFIGYAYNHHMPDLWTYNPVSSGTQNGTQSDKANIQTSHETISGPGFEGKTRMAMQPSSGDDAKYRQLRGNYYLQTSDQLPVGSLNLPSLYSPEVQPGQPHTTSALNLPPPLTTSQSRKPSESTATRTKTLPLLKVTSHSGITWLDFEYMRDKSNAVYHIRCDIDSIDEQELSQEFRIRNCIYPKAMVPPDEYKGHRQQYETICNHIGWRLALLNPELRQKRGLIQRSVDSYRNASEDVKVRSRRARRQARTSQKLS